MLVSNRRSPTLSDMIGCEPNVMDGLRMWFVFSWGEAICPAADIERAAKDIGRVLS